MLHHPYNSLHDVIHVGEVTLAIAVVEDLDFLPFQQFVGEPEIGHVGTATRTIDREETETRTGDVIQFRVSMGHQLIALFCGGIEADGIVHLVVCGIGHFLVAAIDRGAAGIDQVLHFVMAASLQNVVETYQVTLDVAIRIGNAVTDTSLGSEVHHHINLVFRENLLNEYFVSDIAFDKRPILR